MERLGATSGNLVVVRITKVMIAATNHTGNYGVSGRHCKGALKNPIFRPAHPISGRPTPSPVTSQPFSGSPASIYLLVFAFIYVYILFFFPLQFFFVVFLSSHTCDFDSHYYYNELQLIFYPDPDSLHSKTENHAFTH